MKTTIDWADWTWNPVIGCKRNPPCEYCYAKKINNRFKFIKNWDEPEWRERTFEKQFPKKPTKIFVNSMSDINFWKPEWMMKVLDKIIIYPEHRFLFLTKQPMIYEKYNFPENCWLGITITNQLQMNSFADGLFETTFDDNNKIFISIEPILEEIKLYVKPDWLIVGAETGKRKGKIYPDLKWIEFLYENCKKNNVPFFMKDSLKIYGSIIQNYPKDLIFN